MDTTATTATVTQHDLEDLQPRTRFELIVVGVDGSDETLEAVRQAGALADAESTIELTAVGLDNSGEALGRAQAELAHSPARVITKSIDGDPAWKRLLAEAADADLVVVGRHVSSRVGGYVLGSTATHVVHHSHVPVLVAVRPAAGHFPDRIMVTAGPATEHPELAVGTAAGIARHAGSELLLLRVDWARKKRAEAISVVIEEYEREMATSVDDLIVPGNPHRQILATADREAVSLLVLGSRELGGAALRSVSERVAHEANCSVLIVHAGAAALRPHASDE